MEILVTRLKLLKRKKRHLKFIRSNIYRLKYEILNEALVNKTVPANKVDLFYKYNRRLKLLTFLKNG